jgi:hypothetical protein
MKFNQMLVLNRYIISLFGVENIKELTDDMKDTRLEGVDEEGKSLFFHHLTMRLFDNPDLPNEKLEEYDANIMRHTAALKRDIRWKYFQYMSLLFVEIYLDKFFSDREGLLNELNAFLERFNENLPSKERLEPFKIEELNKLALWNATGSGKTLLMHVNLLQFRHYAHNKMDINKTILITPNVGLSEQHLEEFARSHIDAEIFSKEAQSGFRFGGVEIIEITKLADEEGDKTVAVESFEDNNLVFIDEGHRGSSGDKWKNNRDKLSEKGFAFEYSATFGQAISAATKKAKKELTQEYAKAIIYDYSYKYFYEDGYGKDYAILNLDDDSDESSKFTYLVAGVLSFYQQTRIYEENPKLMREYLIEKPLMVFVGSSVNSVRTENRRKVSDVVDILLFIQRLIGDADATRKAIEDILQGRSGLVNRNNEDILVNRFAYMASRGETPEEIRIGLLKLLFHNAHGALHLDNFKGVEGEIGLRLGETGKYFGVINVGDTGELEKLCIAKDLDVSKKTFSHSLFSHINEKESPINLLIGAKKFTEGWSSWRVSTMGLMNVGKKEGSQIIQLFGRGVRLKGKDFSLKRSRAYDGAIEARYQAIETLNVFGVKADYMKQFKAYLEEEGVSTDERVEFVLPVIKDKAISKKKLKIIKPVTPDNISFKEAEKVKLEYVENKQIFRRVVLSRYKKLDHKEKSNVRARAVTFEEEKLSNEQLAFLDKERLYFELQRYKSERNWSNLSISLEDIDELLSKNDWYTLLSPKSQLSLDSFQKTEQIEEVVVSLLKLYVRALYEHRKSEWESQYMACVDLAEDDSNFIKEYKVIVDEAESVIVDNLKALQKLLKEGKIDEVEFKRLSVNDFQVLCFEGHLYQPLLYKGKELSCVGVTPVPLNEGEGDFIEDLKAYLLRNRERFENKPLYLLRNLSKKGLGFFEAGNFYPDFIMWLIDGNKQYVTFIDPKGLRNVDLLHGAKVSFYREIKKLEEKLNDCNIVLNSFIISTTTYQALTDVQNALTKKELTKKHVLFQKDDRDAYIEQLFNALFYE